MLSVLQFSIFLLSCYWRFRVCFISTEKWNKKGKYPDGVQIFTFTLRIDLFDVKDFQKKFLKGIWCCRNFAKEMLINFKLCIHIFNRLLHKTVPAFFLTRVIYFFIAIIRQVLKAYYAWKQLKVDYSNNIWKEENCRHGFVSWLATYLWKKLLKTSILLVQELIK